MTTASAVGAPGLDVLGEVPCLTIGTLRRLIESLPADSPVMVGVRAGHHFNTLIGELPVRAGAAFAGVTTPTLVLGVDGLT